MSIETLQSIQERLPFGIPLEEAFHTKFALHPALLNAFNQTYDCIVNCGYPVTTVINLQGTLNERLALKERITLCKDLANVKFQPGAFLWVIRHYLGLLPTQILPKRIGTAKFAWWRIGRRCEKTLCANLLQSTNGMETTYEVINELLRLPVTNFLLLMSVLNLLRKLSVLPKGEPTVNKKNVYVLVNYFSSSIFTRPFRPGTITKNDTRYYSLLFYLILNWPKIETIVTETSSYALHLPLNNLQSGVLSPKSFQSKSRSPRHDGTQTVTKFQDLILRVIPDWYKDCEFVTDTCCQTEDVIEEKLQSKQKSNKQICCCCCLKKKSKRKKVTDNSSNDESSTSENSKEFLDHAEFLYDEYSRCNLLADDYEYVKDFDPYVKTSIPNKEEIVEIGLQKHQLLGPYILSRDIQEAINRELKEKFASMSMKSAKDSFIDETSTNQTLEIDDRSSLRSKISVEEIPSEVTDSNKSLVSVKKIRSKLEFLRVFRSNLKSGRSFNLEKVKSEIKYQKI